MDENWTLLKQGIQDVPTWQEWAAEQSDGGYAVGVDPTLIAAPEARKLQEKIKKKGGKDLVAVKENLVDSVWGKDRPARPNEKTVALPLEFSGKSIEDKLTQLRGELHKKRCSGFFVSMLDEIAWLYNLRGSDIPYNPVFFAYASVTQNDAILYIDQSKLDERALAHLKGAVTIKPYEAVLDHARAMGSSIKADTADQQSQYMLSTKASWALFQALGGEKNVEEVRSPIGDEKAIKNEIEVKGMRECHVRDGAALTQFFAWLEDELVNKKTKLDEVDAADKLEHFRSQKDLFVGLSFPTISSTGANAAVIHYSPERGNCSVIDPSKVYLCDSGAQYLDGTTDTTRTLHFGEPTDMERMSYTMVLKGNIALELAKFPKGTSGFALDTLARQFLWQQGLDYRHGTGHGVGSYLNVHEGPIGIGTRVQYSEVPLSVGNVISDEPGYYADNDFGVRIENVIVVKEVETPHLFGDKPFLGFDHVTLVPHCRKLIDMSLLTDAEKDYLNRYHAEVEEKTKPLLKGDELTLNWLHRETRPI